MAFVNPFWLWGLSALTIPLLIHLLSRKEGKVIPVGSLRHLRDANTQQFKSLRLNEILLLILRCLLILLVVFFISGLQIQKTTKQKWVLIEDRLKHNLQAKALADSLHSQGYELHQLSSVHISEVEFSSASYWALAEQLQSKSILEAIIISTGRVEDFKGARSEKPSSLKWITIITAPEDHLIAATRKTKDSVTVKSGSLQNENTHLKISTASIIPGQAIFKSGSDSISITSPDAITITLASDPAFHYDKQILIASLKAIKAIVSEHVVINESDTHTKQPDSTDVFIWLSEKSMPPSNTYTSIYYKSNTASPLFQQQSGSQWQLTKRLNEEMALNNNLALELLKIILPNKEQWTIANKKDQRTMPEKMMWANSNGNLKEGSIQAGFTALDQYLIILILIVLITERLIAYKRNQ